MSDIDDIVEMWRKVEAIFDELGWEPSIYGDRVTHRGETVYLCVSVYHKGLTDIVVHRDCEHGGLGFEYNPDRSDAESIEDHAAEFADRLVSMLDELDCQDDELHRIADAFRRYGDKNREEQG